MSEQTFKIKVHPGEILKEEFLAPLEISAGVLAKNLDVPRTRIERLVKEQTAITPDTALRLAKFFGSTPQFWVNLQNTYDLVGASEATDLEHIKPFELMSA